MFILFLVMFTIGSIGAGFCIFLLYRNNQVIKERNRARLKASRLSIQMIKNNEPDCYFPYEVFNSVSYLTILHHFWRPVKSFYAGTILEE